MRHKLFSGELVSFHERRPSIGARPAARRWPASLPLMCYGRSRLRRLVSCRD